MLFKIFLLSLPILIQCAPQFPVPSAAAAEAAKSSQGEANEFDCVCRPIPNNANGEYDCKCKEATPGAGGTGAPSASTPVPDISTAAPAGSTDATPPVLPPADTAVPDAGGGQSTELPPGAVTGATVVEPIGGTSPPPGGGVQGSEGAAPAKADSEPDHVAALTTAFGDTWSYVMCVKRPAGGDKPTWVWLKKDGSNVKINGKWMKFQCDYGTASPLLVLDVAYKAVLEMCKDNGYEVAQPANTRFSQWYPFQTGEYLTEYFHRTGHIVSVTYDRFMATPWKQC